MQKVFYRYMIEKHTIVMVKIYLWRRMEAGNNFLIERYEWNEWEDMQKVSKEKNEWEWKYAKKFFFL